MFRILLAISTVSLINGSARMNDLFGDNMVLQTNSEYGARSFLSGTADPGEVVTIIHQHTTYFAVADTTGRWKATLNPEGYNNKPSTLVVKGQNGPDLIANNVLFGDVFFCSGQSNMVFPLKLTLNASAQIATAADWPMFRLFQANLQYSSTPQHNITGRWVVSNTTTVPDFSAVCFMTVRDVAKLHLNPSRPVGLIQSAWGGTRVEAWSSPEDFKICGVTPPPAGKQNAASALWNGMVTPFVWYSIRAILWYQGEANAEAHDKISYYSCLFNEMIKSWRTAWHIGDTAFVFMQLPPSTPPGTSPTDNTGRPQIRQAQAMALPHYDGKSDNTGMAVGIDLGGKSAWGWDHPIDKGAMSRRLALQVLYTAWAIQPPHINATGPFGPTLTRNNNDHLVITFEGAASGLGKWDVHHCTECCDKANYTFETSKDGKTWDFVPAHQSSVTEAACYYFSVKAQCMGLQKISGSVTVEQCYEACCRDHTCVVWQWKHDECWVGNETHCGSGDQGWSGGTISARYPGRVEFYIPNSTAVVAVRHAWTDFVDCVLMNDNYLPSPPFSIIIDQHKLSNAEVNPVIRPLKKPIVAATPPMGFNSWNFYHCNVDENALLDQAHLFISLGLKDLGYEYINSDDCWQVARLANGTWVPDPVRFPSGIRPLADKVHALGLKVGLYTSQSSETCQGRPASYRHEYIDGATMCDWGVDYLKIDNCGGKRWKQDNESWIRFHQSFEDCYKTRGTPILESIEYCTSVDGCGEWIADVANAWRMHGDVQATWSSITSIIDANTKLWTIARPGHWNDADMLQVGAPGMTFAEQRAHFGLWCIMCSPLLIGTDLSTASNETLQILRSTGLIQLNQDPLGHQGKRVASSKDNHKWTGMTGNDSPGPGTFEVWGKTMVNNQWGVILLNRGSEKHSITLHFDLVPGLNGKMMYTLVDLWTTKKLGQFTGTFSSPQIDPHDILALKIKPSE